jgi:hypothetical protein
MVDARDHWFERQVAPILAVSEGDNQPEKDVAGDKAIGWKSVLNRKSGAPDALRLTEATSNAGFGSCARDRWTRTMWRG